MDFLSIIGAYLLFTVSNSLSSDTDELNGARITDLVEAFRRVAFIESKLSSVKQSQGS